MAKKKKKKKRRKCSLCRSYEPDVYDDEVAGAGQPTGTGDCRRNSPRPFVGEYHEVQWPEVDGEDDWCDDFVEA
ncbi:MAG: hypothetical protein ACYSU0_02840 [Planctomycetota bacterium]|jgi:hypothetical protein